VRQDGHAPERLRNRRCDGIRQAGLRTNFGHGGGTHATLTAGAGGVSSALSQFQGTETSGRSAVQRYQPARAMYDAGGHTVQQIANTFQVSRPTIYRHLAEQAA